LNTVIAGRGITLRLADNARRWLLEKALQERNFGARPLKRALQRYVEDELSEALIQGLVTDGSEVEIVRTGDRLSFVAVGEGLPDLAASKKV
jgi:ATP-dependent Clp protease ATP-binding subunit ClpC